MDPAGQQQFWSGFVRDPRNPENAPLRASDADRDRINDAVAEAYADGRLTTTEMNDRLNAVAGTRTLGEVVALVADLMPVRDPTPRQALAYAGDEEIERRALARYEEKRRLAFAANLPSLICLVIWIASMVSRGGFVFPWPIFVIMFSGGYLSTVLRGKKAAVSEEREKLRRKQLKAREAERAALTEGSEGPESEEWR